MAIIQVQEKSGLGSLLGGLATIRGALTGQPWLLALGTGIGMMNGGGAGGAAGGLGGLLQGQTLKDIFDTLSGAFKNPASGSMVNPAKKVQETMNKVMNVPQINNDWQKALMLQNQNPYYF